MVDGGEADEKIIGVPSSDIDPTYDAIQDIADLPAIERQRIEAFFRVYKQLPDKGKKVELNGYGNAAEAREMVKKAMESYQKQS
ncbi:Inorganic pyrophosphatase [compost metagenome]